MGPDTSAFVRAPLRWAGSKRKSLPTLTQKIPAQFSSYVEPFAGSACLVFAAIQCPIVISDINPDLTEFYADLKTDPEGLFREYIQIPQTPEAYYETRAAFNAGKHTARRSAQFLFLNRYCFNGIYRVNKAGLFNVPWGGELVGKPLSLEELRRAASRLSKATIICGDFQAVVEQNTHAGSFVFLDPPYASDEERVFREYHQDSFSTSDWSRLIDVLHYIDNVGAKFMMSYAGASPILGKLSKWQIDTLEVTRNVGGFRSSRRKYKEVLVSNYEVKQ